MSKRSNLTVTLIGAGIILVALGIVLTATLAPRMTAKKSFRERCETLENMTDFTYLSIFDPLDHSSPLLPTDGETRLTDAAEVDGIRARLLTVLDGAKYVGEEDATSGNWDVRIRFAAAKETVDLYLREDAVYVAGGSVRWVFAPKDTAAYTALYDELLACLPTDGE